MNENIKQIRFQNSIHHAVLRDLHGTNTQLSASNLMYPVFVIDGDNKEEDIESMPGQKRFSVMSLIRHLKPLMANGLKSVLLFGVVDDHLKNDNGSYADDSRNPVIQALKVLRNVCPELLIACDVCLCPYTKTGHCTLTSGKNVSNIQDTINRLVEIALAYAQNGAHIVAPSDMTDNRIAAIKNAFLDRDIRNVSILSYAAKFASSFYGPFRDAAKSAPAFGDRTCYQLPKNSTSLALRAVKRDIDEGADMVMVKPGLPYLDIIHQVKVQHPDCPLFVYQVSGEYCMLYSASQNGALDFEKVLMETMISFRRAGADCIITYFTPKLLDIIRKY